MIPQLQYAKMKCLSSLGPLPHYKHFKVKEQVLVEFESGYKTLGVIISLQNGLRVGAAGTLMYVYFRDKRYSHCRPLGGQGCDCFETGMSRKGRDWNKPPCPMHNIRCGPPPPRRPRIRMVPMPINNAAATAITATVASANKGTFP